MYNIAICDDCIEEREEMLSLINVYFEHQCLEHNIVTFCDGEALLDSFYAGSRYDAYVLDIMMPGLDGMMIAKTIRSHDSYGIIVFVTVSVDYAVQGYAVNALDYIMKPAAPLAVNAFLDRLVAKASKAGTILIKIWNKSEMKELRTHQIVYVESNLHSIQFYMLNGFIEKVYARLEEYAPALTRYSIFIRCHKSYIINLNYVRQLEENVFILNDGKCINISRSYLVDCRKKYQKYIYEKAKGIIV